MATRLRVKAGFGRLPGAVKQGSHASFRRNAMLEGRAGMEAIIKQYSDFIKGMKDITPEVLESAMQPIFDKSQEYVPKNTLALMKSGRLIVTRGPSPSAEIVYGDATAWYAALVHEQVWLNHLLPTRAKYLQAAMEEEFDALLVSLAVDYSGFFD